MRALRFLIAVLVLLPVSARGGWYLMSPPGLGAGDGTEPNPTAPLPRWSVQRSFDAAADCEVARARFVHRPGTRLEAAAAASALCIASDDPRLEPGEKAAAAPPAAVAPVQTLVVFPRPCPRRGFHWKPDGRAHADGQCDGSSQSFRAR